MCDVAAAGGSSSHDDARKSASDRTPRWHASVPGVWGGPAPAPRAPDSDAPAPWERVPSRASWTGRLCGAARGRSAAFPRGSNRQRSSRQQRQASRRIQSPPWGFGSTLGARFEGTDQPFHTYDRQSRRRPRGVPAPTRRRVCGSVGARGASVYWNGSSHLLLTAGGRVPCAPSSPARASELAAALLGGRAGGRLWCT